MKEKVYCLLVMGLLGGLFLLSGCAPDEEEPTAEQPTTLAEPEVDKPAPGDMVLIPAGEFTMGSDEKAGNPPMASPEHKVDLPAYYIDVYEVTNGEFARFQIESDYQAEGDWRSSYSIGHEDYPVANVTWEDAKQYCAWAGKRLPTEAEWEKAARGESEHPYPWGEGWDPMKTNTNEYGTRNVMEIGSMPEDISPYGVYDMMGNVQEWTSEILKAYKGSKARGVDAFNGQYVAVRGASYAMKGGSMYTWTRSGFFPKSQFGLGFRCAKDGEAESEAEAQQ